MEKRIRKYFSDAYKNIEISLPKVEQREFGIGNLEKKIYKRHMGFLSLEELKTFLVNEAPLYISYSAAYYRNPTAPMDRKGFLGADIVFDIDVSLENLDKAKQDIIYLYDVLKQDLGFHEIIVNYSGNRGFHAHVRDKDALGIGKEGRSALVEYFNLEKFNYRELLKNYRRWKTLGSQELEILSSGGTLGPSPSEYKTGFLGKLLATLYSLLDDEGKKYFLKGDWRKVKSSHVKQAIDRIKLNLDVDTQVTSDLSKIIRLENSIHGSTGLQAKILDINKLENFEPWRDAVVLSKEPIIIKITESTKLLKYRFLEGKAYKVPAFLGIYLILQKKAVFSQ